MSGLHAHTSGALGLSHLGWPLDLKWQTTVDDFNAAGYQTILSGINHERHPRTDRYEVDLSRHWNDWKLPRAVDNALDALRHRDTARPFYLNIATQEPHSCIWKDVGTRIPPMPESWPNWLPPEMPRTPALLVGFRKFAAAVAFLDAQFGRLMDGLSELGLADQTLVVFTTDHGMAGPRGKGSLYGIGTEIALLMRQPGILPPGSTRDAPVSNIGFRATWAAAAGVEPVSPCQGLPFWSYAIGDGAPPEDAIFLERNFHGEKPWRTEKDYVDCHDPIRAVRTASHLYIRNFAPDAKPPEPPTNAPPAGVQDWEHWNESWELPPGPRPAEELYDLRTDPLELVNVIDDPAHATTRVELKARLEDWIKATGDFVPGAPPPRSEQPGWGSSWPLVDE